MTDERENDQRFQEATHRAASLMVDHQRDILNFWVDAVLANIPGAKGHGRAELGDHLQNLLDDLIRALNFIGDNASPDKLSLFGGFGLPSSLHGRERASLRGYTVGQVVHEYVVLRRTLTDFFAEHGLKEARTIDVVAHVIEYASLNAVKEFVASVQHVQQKLIGTLVHDVRTPLGVAANYVELLSVARLSDEQKGQALHTITKSLKRAGSMLEDLLDTVALDGGQGLFMRFDEGDIDDALKTVCKEADHLYGENRIRANLTGHPVTGIFDMALVIRTVENLISNAVKFGDKQSPVNVYLEDHDDHVIIRVHNHGNPIPESDISDIFSFFSSSAESEDECKTKSWGLGLSLIRTVVEQHGGEVILESTKEKGTSFGMSLLRRCRKPGEELSVLI